MIKNRFILTLLLLLTAGLIFPSKIHGQLTLEGISIPKTVLFDKDHAPLQLQGAGVRKKLLFKIYVAALYLENSSTNAAGIVSSNEAMAIQIHVTSGMVTSSNMAEATRDGFERSLKGKMGPMNEKIDQFIATFTKEEINEGDVFNLYYSPGIGTRSFKNGSLVSTVQGLEFKKALFGIWLSGDPVQSDLKKKMLGL